MRAILCMFGSAGVLRHADGCSRAWFGGDWECFLSFSALFLSLSGRWRRPRAARARRW
jgi:hypothetical protein